MALPDNDHHVHGEGYRSDRGERNDERMMDELADEIEQIDAVQGVWPEQDVDGAYVEVECDVPQALDAIENEIVSWDARAVEVDERNSVLTVRPE